MEPNVMLKQMLDFNKSAFDNSFTAMLTIQEQNAKMVNTFLEQAAWMPEEGKKLIRNWVDTYKRDTKILKKPPMKIIKKWMNFSQVQNLSNPLRLQTGWRREMRNE